MTSKISIVDSPNDDKLQTIDIQTIRRPATEFQIMVDDIEAPFADSYDKVEFAQNPALRLMAESDIQLMRRGLAPFGNFSGKKFLVAGTGSGREVLDLASRGAIVVGLDATYEYLDLTRRRLIQTNPKGSLLTSLIQCPLENYLGGPEEFDGATSLFGVLNHVEDWQVGMGKIAAALKPGAAFVFSIYGMDTARIFRLIESGQINYPPSILQRRVRAESSGRSCGIRLGEESPMILPTVFPTIDEVREACSRFNLAVELTVGYLNFAALFPKVLNGDSAPRQADLEQFVALVSSQDRKLAALLTPADLAAPEALLRKVFEYDQSEEIQGDLSQFAYIAFVARKKEK